MKLAIIIPAHNEASNVSKLFERLQTVMSRRDEDWKALFVDDGSDDETLTILKTLCEKNSHVGYLSFSRNFGQQAALTAGLDHAEADAFITMDSDLQHPPELIPKMLESWKEGSEIVHAVRTRSADASWFKTWSSRFFYRIFTWLSGSNLRSGSADFRLMDRCVVDALRKMPERSRFLRGMIGWLGFRSCFIEYEASHRLHGHTNYSLGRMFLFGWTAIRSFSTRPLRIATWVGSAASISGMLYLIYVLYARLFTRSFEPGWASIVSAVLILGGIQLLCIGLLGEYLALVFEESKHRPLYVIRSASNKDIHDPKQAVSSK